MNRQSYSRIWIPRFQQRRTGIVTQIDVISARYFLPSTKHFTSLTAGIKQSISSLLQNLLLCCFLTSVCVFPASCAPYAPMTYAHVFTCEYTHCVIFDAETENNAKMPLSMHRTQINAPLEKEVTWSFLHGRIFALEKGEPGAYFGVLRSFNECLHGL